MNYYQILNIKNTATKSEIKNSYKKLVKKYHPDLYDGNKEYAENKIKEINEAYNILSNESSKAEYDLLLTQNEYNNYESTHEIYETSPQESNPQSAFHKYILEKLNKLDTKRQLQIILIIIFIVMILLIINMLELKYYLTNNLTENATNTTIHSTENFNNSILPENSYKNEIQTLDDLLYELLDSHAFNFNYQNKLE